MSGVNGIDLDPEAERKVVRAERWKRIFIVLLAFVVVLSFATNAYALFIIRQTQLEGSPAVQRIDRLSAIVADCVTPTGKCYERGQKQTATAVASINEVTVYAVACALEITKAEEPDRAKRVRRVNACAKALFEDNHPKPEE